MSYTNSRNALKKYGQVGAHAAIEGASPHRLIQILMEGALEKIRTAKGHMQRAEIPDKLRHISWALSIFDGLQASLDMERGGEIAQNLDALYSYMRRRLILGNLENDATKLDEVTSLLLEIKSAWDAVPEILKKDAQSQAAAKIAPAAAP